MVSKPKDVERLLMRKFGFLPAQTHEHGHYWFELTLPGLCIRTKISHSKKDIGPVVEAKMARQLRVRRGFFVQMMSCLRSREEYYQQVTQDPYPPPRC